MERILLGTLLAAGLTWAASAHAHHSTSKFDFKDFGTIEGIVRVADFRNPHSLIILEVVDDSGQFVEHGIDDHSRNIIRRSGLKSGMIQPGDRVTTYYAPSRTDDDMYMRALQLPDGTVLNPSVTAISESGLLDLVDRQEAESE